MISRQTKIQLLVFALLAVVGLAFTGVQYAGLAKLVPGHDDGYVVNADFSDSGGVFKGAEVTYRGVPVGKVEDMTLRPDGVRVALRLRPGTQVPVQTKAQVANRSAVGEQYVDLDPQADGAPYMAEGAVIPLAMTSIPIQPTQLVVNLDKLVKSVNTADVTVVLDELGKAFEGTGDSLQRLVDAGNQLTQAATENLPQTIKLIQDGRKVLATQNDEASNFASYTRDLASLTKQLRDSDPDFRALFDNGTQSARNTTDLLESNRAALPVLLGNLVSTAQVQAVRIPALRQILVTYPNVVAGGFTVTPGDGTAHFGSAQTMDGPVCTQGYEGTKKRDPSDVSIRKPNTAAYCSLPRGSASSVRGGQNAPRPNGLKAFPNDQSQAMQSLFAGSDPSLTSVYADYDPTTGHAITQDGARYTVSSSSSAPSLFGPEAWKWLLLGPLQGS